MDTIELLDQGYAWTSARIAAISADGLDDPTPCSLWSVQELLDHTFDTLAMFTDTVAPRRRRRPTRRTCEPLGSNPWDQAIAELAARSRWAWQAPGVMDRTFELPAPMGAQPGAGGGVGQPARGRRARLGHQPGHRRAGRDPRGPGASRPRVRPPGARRRPAGDHFAADLGIGDTPSDQLVAFLGRKPL